MSARSITTALALYRSKSLTLEEAANYTGISTGKMASALGSRGISVREEDQCMLSGRAAD